MAYKIYIPDEDLELEEVFDTVEEANAWAVSAHLVIKDQELLDLIVGKDYDVIEESE